MATTFKKKASGSIRGGRQLIVGALISLRVSLHYKPAWSEGTLERGSSCVSGLFRGIRVRVPGGDITDGIIYRVMDGIIYLVGLIVVIMAILSSRSSALRRIGKVRLA